MSSPSLKGKILGNRWKLGALLGKGACADVYEATHVRGGEEEAFAAKVVPVPQGLPPRMNKAGKKRSFTEQERDVNMIYYEHTLYHGWLRDHGGVAKVPDNGYGKDQNLCYLVMTRLGPDVKASKEKESWTVGRTAGYARQMLQLLRSLHEKSKLVFVDVKPENFLFGLPGSADEDKIFLIDFGLSSESPFFVVGYRSRGWGRIFDYTGAPEQQTRGKLVNVPGTPNYLSLKCHGGASAGRCDDLESLGYVIVSMLNKSSYQLPWSTATDMKDALRIKKETSLETLCRDCPAGMLRYMKAVRAMTYETAPNYEQLDDMLRSIQRDDNVGTAASTSEPTGTGGRSRGACTRGVAASRMSNPRRGRSAANAGASSSERPAKLRRSERLSS